MKEKTYKSTKKDFERFMAKSKAWIEYFSLGDWFLYWLHTELSGAFANLEFNVSTRNATLTLSTKGEGYFNADLSAFHEACELLLAPMTDVLFEHLPKDEVLKLSHQVIARLENSIYRDLEV